MTRRPRRCARRGRTARIIQMRRPGLGNALIVPARYEVLATRRGYYVLSHLRGVVDGLRWWRGRAAPARTGASSASCGCGSRRGCATALSRRAFTVLTTHLSVEPSLKRRQAAGDRRARAGRPPPRPRRARRRPQRARDRSAKGRDVEIAGDPRPPAGHGQRRGARTSTTCWPTASRPRQHAPLDGGLARPARQPERRDGERPLREGCAAVLRPDDVIPFTAGDGALQPDPRAGARGRPRARCSWCTAPASAPTSSARPSSDIRRRPDRAGLRRLAGELARQHRPAAQRWTLDQAAVHDHPVAVAPSWSAPAPTAQGRRPLPGFDQLHDVRGRRAAARGDHIVANAMALHPVVTGLAQLKLRFAVPLRRRVLGYLNPQWGLAARPDCSPKLISRWSAHPPRMRQPACAAGQLHLRHRLPPLWRHENLNVATHEWLRTSSPTCRCPSSADGRVRRGRAAAPARRTAGAAGGPSSTSRRRPTPASCSSPANRTTASCPRASAARSTTSNATPRGGTRCTWCQATATWTCSSARTPARASFR